MAANFPLIAFICSSAALLTAGAVVRNDDNSVCPEGWTLFKKRCFKFFEESMTWANAEISCSSHGGHLASIHSSEENSLIVDLIRVATGENSYTWLGGHDAAKEKLWMWSDGTPWDYTNWAKGQPANAGGKEHYLAINWPQPVDWNDALETNTHSYICAKDATEPEYSTAFTLEGIVCKCFLPKK